MTAFLDTAVFMYAAGADHPLRRPCQQILTAIAAGRFPAVTSAEVVQEILHRYVGIRRPELGAAMAQHTLDLMAPVLPLTHEIVSRVPKLLERYGGLSARDLVHVATCVENGLDTIVSPDAGFADVREVTAQTPFDLAGAL